MAEGTRAKLSDLITQHETELVRLREQQGELEATIKANVAVGESLAQKLSEVTAQLAAEKTQSETFAKTLVSAQAKADQALRDFSASSEAHFVSFETKAEEVAAAVESAQEGLSAITKVSGQVDQLLTSSTASAQATKSLASNSTSIAERISKYDEFYTASQSKYKETLSLIEGLLPSATSAGLAAAFESQKETYSKGLTFWTWMRMISLSGILIYGVVVYQDLTTVADKIKDNGLFELFLTGFVWLVNKSPILLALILFEEFGRRTYNRYFKLQQDYSYKKVVSQSFEGYKKQLLDLGENFEGNAVLNDLCRNVVNSIAENPIRLINEEKERDRFRFFSPKAPKEGE